MPPADRRGPSEPVSICPKHAQRTYPRSVACDPSLVSRRTRDVTPCTPRDGVCWPCIRVGTTRPPLRTPHLFPAPWPFREILVNWSDSGSVASGALRKGACFSSPFFLSSKMAIFVCACGENDAPLSVCLFAYGGARIVAGLAWWLKGGGVVEQSLCCVKKRKWVLWKNARLQLVRLSRLFKTH